jgi:hypothetical protein
MLLDKRYRVTVTRSSHSRGQLVIFDTYLTDGKPGSTCLLSMPVRLLHNADHGPDIDDVMTWERMAIDFIDKVKDKEKDATR